MATAASFSRLWNPRLTKDCPNNSTISPGRNIILGWKWSLTVLTAKRRRRRNYWRWIVQYNKGISLVNYRKLSNWRFLSVRSTSSVIILGAGSWTTSVRIGSYYFTPCACARGNTRPLGFLSSRLTIISIILCSLVTVPLCHSRLSCSYGSYIRNYVTIHHHMENLLPIPLIYCLGFLLAFIPNYVHCSYAAA